MTRALPSAASARTPFDRPGPAWLRRGDRGVAVLLSTVILSFVALSVAAAHFMQDRSHRFELMRQRALVYARYCSEYAVARYGLPAFTLHPELADRENENNWIEPRSMSDVMGAQFQQDDAAHTFSFAYDSLKMDKVFDTTSGKAFFFVSAQGVVSWRDGGGRVHEARHRSALGLTFTDFSRFMYFSNGETGPEGSPVYFGDGEEIQGRVHINGAANIRADARPHFHGYYTQTLPFVQGGLDPSHYDEVFLESWSMPSMAIAWPPEDAINQIRERRLGNHTYERSVLLPDGEHPLTTWLKFDRNSYHVAQYVADSLNGADTVYVPLQGGQNWLRKALPPEGYELIYVKGVCRTEGIVTGKITVLASDTLYITDNIYTSDADTWSCAVANRFGMVPIGSPNRIGLASEGNIVIAATLPNGFSNGVNAGPACGIVDDSNLLSCFQGRQDVLITAALFATDCSIEAEFWNTTARNAPPQSVINPQEAGCSGSGNTHIHLWSATDCPGASPTVDARGTVWICGSIVQTHRGFIRRSAPGPWAGVDIGYAQKRYRYDENFLSGGPPVWFRVTYEDGSQDVATEMVVPDYDRWRRLRRQELGN